MTQPDLQTLPTPIVIERTLRYLEDFRKGGGLPMFTVTDHPSDHPEHYVARLGLARSGGYEVTAFAILDTRLDGLRAILEALGFVKLDRSPQDDPVILETWI